MIATADLFTDVIELPNPDAQERYGKLVGLDTIQERLSKRARLLLIPSQLDEWSRRHHGGRIALIDSVQSTAPLFVFAGDVGTGKTALAESFGDPIARDLDLPVTLYRLSLNARGTGAVGEMTRLVGDAFAYVREVASKARTGAGQPKAASILLIDEADALAQSRELGQMHHEDRAGVNALIRGIDDLAAARAPIIVVMCTNRLEAIDPAVRRRAAEVFSFARPDHEQRLAILTQALADAGLSMDELQQLASLTGDNPSRPWGFTYSDLRQRLLPTILIEAFPSQAVTFELVCRVINQTDPTPPFVSESPAVLVARNGSNGTHA